jgi:hypothetical protein
MADEPTPDDVNDDGPTSDAGAPAGQTDLRGATADEDGGTGVGSTGTAAGSSGAGTGSSDADHVDELPEDLDAAGFVGPYLFPNNNRRRVPGYLYLAAAALCVGTWALVDDSPYVNGGFLFAAALLTVVGAYQLLSGWNLAVDEQGALVAASQAVGFPVGHASAQMGWRGLLSRPTWRILLYSAENPPTKRGLVLVDGVDGETIQHFVEDNPEDWSDLDGDISAG